MKVYEVWCENDMTEGRLGRSCHSTYKTREEAVDFMDQQPGIMCRMPSWFRPGATWSNQTEWQDWQIIEREIDDGRKDEVPTKAELTAQDDKLKIEELQQKIKALRTAVSFWPAEQHRGHCGLMHRWPTEKCNCGAASGNAAREEARKILELD